MSRRRKSRGRNEYSDSVQKARKVKELTNRVKVLTLNRIDLLNNIEAMKEKAAEKAELEKSLRRAIVALILLNAIQFILRVCEVLV